MTLPYFIYHPDPLGSGSVQPSSTVCVSCDQARGYPRNRRREPGALTQAWRRAQSAPWSSKSKYSVRIV